MSGVNQREEALREYYQAQSAMDSFDNRSFQIKSWSITVGAAAAGAAVTQGAPDLYALAAIAALAFWIIDALWKSFQVIWQKRGVELEDLLNGAELRTYTGPRIHQTFRREFKVLWSWLRIIPCLFRANVMLPHMPLALLFVGLFIDQTGMAATACANGVLPPSVCAVLIR
jgi:hypothetical protein